MNERIEKFIATIIDLIDDNEWESIYTTLEHDYSGEDIGDFTTYMYAAGIDPLIYLDRVPQHYLYYSTLTDPKLHEGIKEIEHGAFSNSAIEKLNPYSYSKTNNKRSKPKIQQRVGKLFTNLTL